MTFSDIAHMVDCQPKANLKANNTSYDYALPRSYMPLFV